MAEISFIWADPDTGGRLYVGSHHFTVADLERTGIDVVVSAATLDPSVEEAIVLSGRTHVWARFPDMARLPATDIERSAVSALLAALGDGRGALVHCQGGINRGPYLASRVLMRRGFSADDAVRTVARGRDLPILSNRTFLVGLIGERAARTWRPWG